LGKTIIPLEGFREISNTAPFFTAACKARILGLFLNSSVTGVKHALGTNTLWQSTKMGAFGSSLISSEMNSGSNDLFSMVGLVSPGLCIYFCSLGMVFHIMAVEKQKRNKIKKKKLKLNKYQTAKNTQLQRNKYIIIYLHDNI